MRTVRLQLMAGDPQKLCSDRGGGSFQKMAGTETRGKLLIYAHEFLRVYYQIH